MTKKRVSTAIFMMIMSLLLGGIVALVVWLFMGAIRLTTSLLWGDFAQWTGWVFFPLVVCVIGGVIIGLWQKYIWPMPTSLEQSMEAIKKDKKFPYRGAWKTAISAFLPLAFGGSVGPEAGLVNIIAGLCSWVGDKLKRFHIAFSESARIGLAAVITTLFGAPLGGIIAPIEARDEKGYQPPRVSKIILYILAVVGGFGALLLLNTYVGGGAGLPTFERTVWNPGELLLSIPLAIVGVLAGYLYFAADKIWSKISDFFKKNIIAKAIICGVILGLCGMMLPMTMFSGEEQMAELIQNFSTMGMIGLIATGLIKLIVTPLCVRFGWNGGNIFPVIFAGVSLGYGVAGLSGLDSILCVTVITTAVSATVMKRPLLAVGILFLCFPIADIIFMLIAAGLSFCALALVNVAESRHKTLRKTQ